MTTQLLDTEIVYDRTTRDYAVIVCGVIVGFGRNFVEAEAVRTRVLAERRDDGYYHTATLLDGGALADPTPSEPSPDLIDNDDGRPELPNIGGGRVNWSE